MRFNNGRRVGQDDLLDRGHQMVLTHGNGPQVGFLQLHSELARETLPEVPLDSLIADSHR